MSEFWTAVDTAKVHIKMERARARRALTGETLPEPTAWLTARCGKSQESRDGNTWTERDTKLVNVCIRLQLEAPEDHARRCPNCKGSL